MIINLFRNLMCNIREDGLIVSSSGFLVRSMLQRVDFSRSLRILEIGSGRGAFTREILQRMAPGSELHVSEIKTEYNPYIEALMEQHPQHEVRLFNGCITELLSEQQEYDVIISSLPLKSFTRSREGRIFLNQVIEALRSGLKEGGTYLQYQYFMSNKADIERIFGRSMDNIGFVALNILPAFIYQMTKQSEELLQPQA